MFHKVVNLKLVVGTYGRMNSSVQWKKILKVPLRLSFIAYLLNSNYETLAERNPTFWRDNFFPSFQNIDKSVSTQRCERNLFSPKKGKNMSKFWMVSLCNGGTKDFVELWEIIYLKIWTRFSTRQTKLFWINWKNYSQTCLNHHLCKTNTCLRWPMVSLPKQIPGQSLLHKTTTCLLRPATYLFLSSKLKKGCLKQLLINFIKQRNMKQT